MYFCVIQYASHMWSPLASQQPHFTTLFIFLILSVESMNFKVLATIIRGVIVLQVRLHTLSTHYWTTFSCKHIWPQKDEAECQPFGDKILINGLYNPDFFIWLYPIIHYILLSRYFLYRSFLLYRSLLDI